MMLFQVRMDVNIPIDGDPARIESLKAVERARCQELMNSGKWRHIWRIAGHYANISIFDVESVTELHDIVSTLPLFPFMKIEVAPLCRHPSSIRDNDL